MRSTGRNVLTALDLSAEEWHIRLDRNLLRAGILSAMETLVRALNLSFTPIGSAPFVGFYSVMTDDEPEVCCVRIS